MRRFLRILLFLFILRIGQVSVVLATRAEKSALCVTESVLHTDGYSSSRYSDFDSPCGSSAVTVPSPVFSPVERGDGGHFWNSRRPRTAAFASYASVRLDRLLSRHGSADSDRLATCHFSGALSPENLLFFLCILKN